MIIAFADTDSGTTRLCEYAMSVKMRDYITWDARESATGQLGVSVRPYGAVVYDRRAWLLDADSSDERDSGSRLAIDAILATLRSIYLAHFCRHRHVQIHLPRMRRDAQREASAQVAVSREIAKWQDLELLSLYFA